MHKRSPLEAKAGDDEASRGLRADAYQLLVTSVSAARQRELFEALLSKLGKDELAPFVAEFRPPPGAVWQRLQSDCVRLVFEYLDAREQVRASKACKHFWHIHQQCGLFHCDVSRVLWRMPHAF